MPVDLYPFRTGLLVNPRTDYAFLFIGDEQRYLIIDPNYFVKNVVFKYVSEDHGLRKIFPLDPKLIDRPEVLAHAYREEGNLVGLIYRLFSAEAIFTVGGQEATNDLSMCLSDTLRFFREDYDTNVLDLKPLNHWFSQCLGNLVGLHGKTLVFSGSTPVPLLFSLEEKEFMEQARNMHIEAIKIYLADTHIQPNTTIYGRQGNFLLNLDNHHQSYSQIFGLFTFRPPSILQLVRLHPFFREIWDLNYTDLSIFFESKWIFNEPRSSYPIITDIYFPIDIQPSSPNLESVGLGLVDDFIRSRCPVFYVSAEEPEDIFASSINIFDESEQTVESPDVGAEDYLEDGLWIFEEEE